MENSQPSTSNSKVDSANIEEVTCKKCGVNYPVKSIVQHAKKSKCSSKYKPEEVAKLLHFSQEISKMRKAQRYKDKRNEINQTRRDNYDKLLKES